MTRKQYRANWARRDYARRRREGQCIRCPSKSRPGLARCAECEKLDTDRKRDAYRRAVMKG